MAEKYIDVDQQLVCNYGILFEYTVACQVHPALVKCSRGIRAYVNVSPLVHLSVSSGTM